jgi:homoserine O-acetyltransferase
VLALAATAGAVPIPESVPGDYVLRDFRFRTGEVLPELRIHYRTIGTPRRDAAGAVANAVLILHGTGGSGAQFLTENFAGVLFGPGQLLDSARWYLILPDGIGHGGSTKPSDGRRARFPGYTYDDMVDAQHRLLVEGLKVDHLRLVIGTSMGGMHAWVWGEKFPTFMDGLVPLASVPIQIAGRNRMLRKMIIDDIRGDPEWRNGDYERQPRGLTAALQVLLFMVSSPLQWHKSAPTRDAADRILEEQMRTRLATADANDMLYAFEASREYDPSGSLEKIRVPVLAINSADDVVNPPELGLMERLIARVPKGRYVLIPTGPETRGHGTHSWPALWQQHLKAFLEELDRRGPPREREQSSIWKSRSGSTRDFFAPPSYIVALKIIMLRHPGGNLETRRWMRR